MLELVSQGGWDVLTHIILDIRSFLCSELVKQDTPVRDIFHLNPLQLNEVLHE